NREETDVHRRKALIQRVECGRQHLDAGVADQTDGVEAQRPRGFNRGVMGESSAFVDETDDGLCEANESDCRRNRQEERETDSARENVTKVVAVANCRAA